MGKTILIASGKGGVGKSTATASIGYFLASLGHKTVVIDMDMGLRNLDIFLDVETGGIFDISDLLDNDCPLDKALNKIDCPYELYFIQASSNPYYKVTAESLKKLIFQLHKMFKYIILDCPAGIGPSLEACSRVSNMAVLVTLPNLASVRDAQKTYSAICQSNIREYGLVVNRIRPKFMNKQYCLNIDEIIDRVGIGLLGLVPEDELFAAGKNLFEVHNNKKAISSISYENIAKRITGIKAPLFRFWEKRKYKKI